MADYKKMYALMYGAASDSLDILSRELNTDSINSVRFLLQQAIDKTEIIYVVTAEGQYNTEKQDE